MRTAVNNLARLGIVAGAVLLGGLAGCKSTPDRSASQVWSDHFTGSDVKKALAKAPIFKYNDVNVTTYKGSVQLTGFVETEEQRAQAAQIAANVPGVTQVINGIMIKPTPTGRATIRDPLGQETGRVLLDTNAPPPAPIQVPRSETTPGQTNIPPVIEPAPPEGTNP